jgi:arsenate reductase (thioredoxin)
MAQDHAHTQLTAPKESDERQLPPLRVTASSSSVRTIRRAPRWPKAGSRRGGNRYAAFSAGTHPRTVHPLAIRAMAELGVDISETTGHYAKSLDTFRGQTFDLVVTVCDDAAAECPFFPGARRQEHWGFPDPSAATGTEAERLEAFRHVRDAIDARITQFLDDAG